MKSIFPKLFEMLPDADAFLALEPEELAGPLLVSLEGNQDIKPSKVISAYSMQQSIMSNENIQRYPQKDQNKMLFALMEAWQWLVSERFIAPRPTILLFSRSMGELNSYFVTRRGKRIKTSEALAAYRKANLLPKRQLHPIIAEKVWALFLRGDYDVAVFQAFKQVEVAVRKAGDYKDTNYGYGLMREAFNPENGKLTDKNQNQQKGEKQACSDLFAGAIGFYKNPSSHRNVDISAEETAEVIIFAGLLLRIVDSRREQASSH